MKNRAGFKPIVVDNKKYIYTVSLQCEKIIFYNEMNEKKELSFSLMRGVKGASLMDDSTIPFSWRGKHKDGMWDKARVSYMIKNFG